MRLRPPTLAPLATIALTLAVACQFSASTSPNADTGEGKPATTAGDGAADTPAADADVTAKPADPGGDSGETPAATDQIAAEPPKAEHPGHEPPKPTSPAATDKVTASDPNLCDDGKHKKGERWKVECNECWCGDDGKVACTRKGCVGDKK